MGKDIRKMPFVSNTYSCIEKFKKSILPKIDYTHGYSYALGAAKMFGDERMDLAKVRERDFDQSTF